MCASIRAILWKESWHAHTCKESTRSRSIASTSMQPNLALGTPVKSRLAPEALPVLRCNPIWLWDCMRQHLGPKWSYVNTYAGHPRESDTPHKLKLRAHRRFPASPRLECRVRLFISVQLCIDIYTCCTRAFTHAHSFPIS